MKAIKLSSESKTYRQQNILNTDSAVLQKPIVSSLFLMTFNYPFFLLLSIPALYFL